MVRLGVLGLALSAAGLAAAGCGGEVSSPSVAKSAIRVMTIYSKSGAVAFPRIPDGADAAVRAINKAGGVKGRPLHLIACDDGGNAGGAAACGRKAVEEGVVALVGTTSLYGSAYLPLMVKRRIADLGNIPASVADFISPAAFPLSGGPPATFAGLPRFLADAGAKRIALVRPDLAPAAGAAAIANVGLEPKRLTVRQVVKVPVTAPDMSTYAAQAIGNGIDGVVVILPGPQAINFAQELRQSARDLKIAMASTDPGALRKALGSAAAGIVQALDILPPAADAPGPRRYVDEMRAAGHDELLGYQQNAWLSVHVLAQVARGVPRVTAPAIWKALNRTSNLRTGLTPPVQFRRGGIGSLPRIFTACALAAEMTAAGDQEPVTGRFYDAFNSRPCPSP